MVSSVVGLQVKVRKKIRLRWLQAGYLNKKKLPACEKPGVGLHLFFSR
jgi:hypothetical protein